MWILDVLSRASKQKSNSLWNWQKMANFNQNPGCLAGEMQCELNARKYNFEMHERFREYDSLAHLSHI